MQAILEQTDEDSKPVAHGGPKADLVGLRAIMSRNRDFLYPEPIFLKLDQDLRVMRGPMTMSATSKTPMATEHALTKIERLRQ